MLCLDILVVVSAARPPPHGCSAAGKSVSLATPQSKSTTRPECVSTLPGAAKTASGDEVDFKDISIAEALKILEVSALQTLTKLTGISPCRHDSSVAGQLIFALHETGLCSLPRARRAVRL